MSWKTAIVIFSFFVAAFVCCVQVGRVRANDVFGDHGLDFFVCGDQLLRGAALNAVLIAEALVASSVADAVAA